MSDYSGNRHSRTGSGWYEGASRTRFGEKHNKWQPALVCCDRVFGLVAVGAGEALFILTDNTEIFQGEIFLSLALIAAGLITFFGVLGHVSVWKGGILEVDPGHIRTALTVTIVTVYFVMLSEYLFFYHGNVPSVVQSLVTSFTALVTVVVPSYFGASAYTQVKEKEREQNGVHDRDETPPPRDPA